mmetsp:Transcript_10727/g.23326  ORF Transcript_10727/g.23326 Transcript_10727/m.23326 type:complete len:240 (-) Transcript_10727:395-1114(-)
MSTKGMWSRRYPFPSMPANSGRRRGWARTDLKTRLSPASHSSIPPRSRRGGPSPYMDDPPAAFRSAGSDRATASSAWAVIAALQAATSSGDSTPRTTRKPFRSKRYRSESDMAAGGGGGTASSAILAGVPNGAASGGASVRFVAAESAREDTASFVGFRPAARGTRPAGQVGLPDESVCVCGRPCSSTCVDCRVSAGASPRGRGRRAVMWVMSAAPADRSNGSARVLGDGPVLGDGCAR